MENSKVKLNVLGITFSQVQAGAYALVLSEDNGVRRVPIIIGTPEAQSIAIFLEGLHPPRPLTHDLFLAFMSKVNVELKEVFIHKFKDGVFYSKLIFSQDGKEIVLDSRTSDAIAIAIRTSAAIFTTEEIMNEAGIIMEDEEEENEMVRKEKKTETGSIETMSVQDLKNALDEAISAEDYEKASNIRDILNKRQS